jgi:hypothetical protein
MRKIDTLRAALFAAIPELSSDYSRLQIWIDRGQGQARQTASNSFGLAFRLNVLAIEVSTDLSLIVLAITRWLRTNQPDRLQPDTDSFTFDADILDERTADILIQIDLTQNYVVTVADGVETVEALEQNDPVLDELFGPDRLGNFPPLSAISVEGEGTIAAADPGW